MIRKAKNSDIDKINNLGEQLHQDFKKLFHIETEINNEIAIVLVCEENNDINGYLYAQCLDNIDLLSIFVDNKHRKKHIGTSLIKHLVDNYPDKDIILEVAEDNKAAIGLYEKLGFKTINIRKKYYNDKDALVMKRGI